MCLKSLKVIMPRLPIQKLEKSKSKWAHGKVGNRYRLWKAETEVENGTRIYQFIFSECYGTIINIVNSSEFGYNAVSSPILLG